MRSIRHILATIALAGSVLMAAAAEAPPASPAAATEGTGPRDAEARDAEEKDAETAAEPTDVDQQAESPTGTSPDVFVPTEEISRDRAIAFPVDI